MGSGPKTKAECDKEIAREESSLGNAQAILANTSDKGSNYAKSLKSQIAYTKARIRELKALRRSLPNK